MEIITGGEAGGAQRHVAELIDFLHKQQHVVTLVYGGGDWIRSRVGSDVRIHHLSVLQRNVNPIQDCRAFRALLAMIRQGRPDVVHCHSSKAGILGRYAAHRAGVPSVYTAHGFVFQDPTKGQAYRRLFRYVEQKALLISRALIVMTAADESFAREMLPSSRVFRIPNGVSLADLPARPDAGRRVGFIGRFSGEKGLEVLLEVARRHSEWEFHLAGDGPFRALVEAAQQTCSWIHWNGWVENTQQFLRGVDALVQPSRKEGAPYTVLDGMALGIPVVVSDVGAMGEMMSPVDSRLVIPPGNGKALETAIAIALKEGPYLGLKARRIAGDRYSLNEQLLRTEAVLKEAAGTL